MKERNIPVNKLDTIAVLTISLIVKEKNSHKCFEFLLRETEAQREIKKVRERQGHRETEKKTQREKYSMRHRDHLRERRDRRQKDKEGHKDKHFLFSNCILSNEKLNVFQL